MKSTAIIIFLNVKDLFMSAKLVISFILFVSTKILAIGGWVGSGGEIFENDKNPWFVENTKEVYYCVLFSESEFSISKAETINLVSESIRYWTYQLDGRSALDFQTNDLNNSQELRLADQKFIYQNQCDNTSLIFKFGFQVLDEEEKKSLVSPSKYLGVTIRKTYDVENFKGTGIIYITGDLGEHRYKSSHKETIAKAWKYPKLLQYVITHELGHVFGIPHSGSGLMSETFLDTLLIQNFAVVFLREPFLPFLKPQKEHTICDSTFLPKGSQSFIGSYFKLNNNEDCLRFEATENSREFLMLTKKFKDSEWVHIGKLVINQTEVTDFSLKPSMVLKLPEKRNYFLDTDKNFLLGPVYQNFKVDGHILFNGSMKTHNVQVDISTDSLIIFGIVNNKVRQVFKFGNPLMYVLKLPF